MAFLNWGKKDTQGKQVRLEHRGQYLRASRTGGVALRSQAQAAGLTLTANTQQGVRVSTRLAKHTQLATQNGRLVLRGRYGRGPNHLNLSKSGVSASTQTALGTFNWLRPGASSVKLGGIQVRGKKAANIQMIYSVIMLTVFLLQLVGWGIVCVVKFIAYLVSAGRRLSIYLPAVKAEKQRQARNRTIQQQAQKMRTKLSPPVAQWSQPMQLAVLILLFVGYGRGQPLDATARRLANRPATDFEKLLVPAQSELEAAASHLQQTGIMHADDSTPFALIALVAEHLRHHDQLIDLVWAMDALMRRDGPRTQRQDQLLEVFTDFAGLKFTTTEPAPATADTPDNIANSDKSTVNLNTASLAELQQLPHIGESRAHAIIALRPIKHFSALSRIEGIGPARIADIKQYGISL